VVTVYDVAYDYKISSKYCFKKEHPNSSYNVIEPCETLHLLCVGVIGNSSTFYYKPIYVTIAVTFGRYPYPHRLINLWT